jgi:iron complex outermembrane receptor protein
MFASIKDLANMGAVSADSGIARGIAFGGITTTDRFKIASSTTGPDLNPDGPKHYMDSSSLRLDASFSAFDVAAYVTDASNNERRWGDYDGNSFNDIDVVMTENQSEETSAGIEISSNGTGPLSWIVGMNYFDQEVNYDFDLRIGAIGGGNVPASTGWGTYWLDTYGVFASVDYELSDAWTISVGGRYTKEEKDIYWRPSSTEYAQNERITLAAALLPNEDGEEWSSFDPKVTLTYNFASGGIAYATYSTGFKSGGYNAPTRQGGEALDPEELDMIELGYKADLTSNLRLTSSIFFYDYTGLQVTRAAKGTGTVTTENAADSSVKGIDFDFTWAATDNLTVRFGGEFLDAEYEDYETGGRVANTILTGDPTAVGYGLEFFNAEGHPLLRAADMSFFIAGNYESGPVSVNLNYSWTDEYYFDFVLNPASGSLIQPSHGILNGRLTYAVSDDLSVSLWGKNMTDEIYLNDSVMAATNQRINYAHPRTWGADISYRF